MRFTNWMREELMPWIAVTSLYGVVVPSVIVIGATFTVDALNIGASNKFYSTVKYKSYAIGASAGLIGTIAFSTSFAFLIADKLSLENRLSQSRLSELERLDSEARKRVREILSKIPKNCRSCKYCTKNIYLLCTVHPTDMQENCKD
ncbi:MAG: hypothetical protein KME29_14105 [Calothrix sp. FI2-JRJ7]|jgi:hypothetical protein|nr:hypothetical protein [Calothrix sp. FI2-JRJ7]